MRSQVDQPSLVSLKNSTPKKEVIMNSKPTSHFKRTDFLAPVVNELIRLRLEKNLSQEEVNHRLGVTDHLVDKWECGIRTPGVFNLHCWALTLNARLMVASNDNTPQNDPEPPKLVANDNRLLMVA